jgi:hypothetical protein
MKILKYILTLLGLSVALAPMAQQVFTAGNIVVYRVGDGTAALNGGAAKVYLDEYTPGGTLVQSILMPVTGKKLTAFGNDAFGFPGLSANGKYLIVPGNNIDPGTSTLGQRSIGIVDCNGDAAVTLVDNPTLAFMRSCTSNDGNNLWFADGANSAVDYVPNGSSAETLLATVGGSSNSVCIANGQLYASGNGNGTPMVAIGTGLPTAAGQTATALPGIPIRTRPQQFAFADLDATVAGVDVLYLASQNPGSPGGIQKYSLVAGTWTFNGQIGATADKYSGLAIKVSSGGVTIFATRQGSNSAAIGGGQLVALTDNSGYNGALSGTPAVIASVATADTKAFRGVALVPQPTPFTTGNIVVYRVGDGSATLNGGATKVYLDEFTPGGTLVQSVLMPATGKKVTAYGNDAFGFPGLSANGKYLIVPGNNADLGATTLGQLSMGIVDFNTTTSVTLVDNPTLAFMRSGISDDGNNLWFADGSNSGVDYATNGSTASTLLGTVGGSSNAVGIANGQLYASTNGNGTPFVAVGTGLPTTAGQTATALPGIPIRTRPQQFAFADLDPNVVGVDVLYLASQNPGSPGGIQKYSLVSGTWTFNGQVGTTAEKYAGLAIKVSSSGVTIFATRQGANSATIGGGQLVALTDNSGYNGTLSGTPAVIASIAAADTKAYRGIALVPQGCVSPKTLQAINVTASQATLTWDIPAGGSNNYEYAVTTSFVPPVSGTGISGNSVSVTGLVNNTTYYGHVKAVCSGQSQSGWSTVSFITNCKAPAAPQLAINISGTGNAKISWNKVFGAASYEYVISTSSTPPPSGTSTTDTSISLANINAVTQYYVHVRSNCDANTFSGWTTKPFKTGCFMPAPSITVLSKKSGATWAQVNNSVKYEYALTNTAAKPVSGTYTTDTMYLFQNVTDAVSYYFHVRSVCATGAVSEWSTIPFDAVGLQAYPNPVRETLQLKVNGNSSPAGEVIIGDASGRVVARFKMTGNTMPIDTRGWAAGIYMIRYKDDQHQYTLRVLKQ